MTKEEWFKKFDKTKDTFKWFFDKYYESSVWNTLISFREDKNIHGVLGVMNRVWFVLPDNKFNIKINPPGWGNFLTLLEEEIDYDTEN